MTVLSAFIHCIHKTIHMMIRTLSIGQGMNREFHCLMDAWVQNVIKFMDFQIRLGDLGSTLCCRKKKKFIMLKRRVIACGVLFCQPSLFRPLIKIFLVSVCTPWPLGSSDPTIWIIRGHVDISLSSNSVINGLKDHNIMWYFFQCMSSAINIIYFTCE